MMKSKMDHTKFCLGSAPDPAGLQHSQVHWSAQLGGNTLASPSTSYRAPWPQFVCVYLQASWSWTVPLFGTFSCPGSY